MKATKYTKKEATTLLNGSVNAIANGSTNVIDMNAVTITLSYLLQIFCCVSGTQKASCCDFIHFIFVFQQSV